MDTTPSLPVGGGTRADAHPRQHTSTAQAHRVRLYGALDAVSVTLGAADVQAVFQLAEMDCVTVHAVIDWLNTARMLPHPT